MTPDLSVQLGPLHLKNPLICASSEFTLTEAGIRSALDAGAAAVIAKSVNEPPQAAHQLDTAEYILLDDNSILNNGPALYCSPCAHWFSPHRKEWNWKIISGRGLGQAR